MPGVLDIRRTLVLGLGTTGKEVAERLAEHLTWQFGHFERAKWVRLLVLETEQPSSPLGDRVLRGGITRQEYAPYLNSPSTTGAEFGFADWQDGPSLSAITNPATGAGNLRMLGRLCLFHPQTYKQLELRVTREVSELKTLTAKEITEGLQQPGLSVNMHSDIVVYVVGTLCGGTCSGGAADLGYLVDIWSGGSVDRQAIFTIPHQTLTGSVAARYKKNAYYALTELNHFQLSSTRWVQKLPGHDRAFVKSEPPYDITRVVMPQGGAAEDVARLNVMISQYLAAAVGLAGKDIAARDADAKGKMTSTESIGFMRPLFSTMGVAALEYPGEHIQRAATTRLMAAALERWCRHQITDEMVKEALNLLGGMDFKGLLQRLTADTDRIGVAVFQEVFRPMQEGDPPRVEQVRQLLRQTEDRLVAEDLAPGEGADAALPTLLQVMQKNHDAFLTGIESSVHAFVDKYLFDLDGGPGFIAEVLKSFLGSMESWATTAQQSLQELQQDARSLREIMDEQIDAVEKVQQSRNPFNRRVKLREGWTAVPGSVQTYLQTEIKTRAISHMQRRRLVQEMVEHYRRVTAMYLRRLEQMQEAFSQTAAQLGQQWKELASKSPDISGHVYFTPETPAVRGTVAEEYYNLLRQRRWPNEPVTLWDDSRKEEAAERSVVEALAALREELTRTDGSSPFDQRPGVQSARDQIPAAVLDAAEARARTFFEPLRQQVHVADKASNADLDSVIQKSEPRLAISAAQVSDQLAGVKGASPAVQEMAFMETEANGAADNPNVVRIEERVRNQMSLRNGQITNSGDPFRLLLIREKHGFTLGQMEGVVRAHTHDNSALQSADGCADFHFWHTRRDVEWADPLTPPNRVDATEEAWLQVVLLGGPADHVLEWTPANRDEIDKGGWYQVAGGEFRVFYPPGLDEISDREARLPLSFPEAVAMLLSRDRSTLRRCLSMRISSYIDKSGYDRLVRVYEAAISALHVFGVTNLDKKNAEQIVRRAYRRNDNMVRAFFEFKTESLEKSKSEFAGLWHMQGTPIEGRDSEYPADAYYCPNPACNRVLGDTPENLLANMFRCPACTQRYWP